MTIVEAEETRTVEIKVRRARIIDRVNYNRIVDQLTPHLEQTGELSYVGNLLIEFAMLMTRTEYIEDFTLPTLPASTETLYQTFQAFMEYTDEFVTGWWNVMLQANAPLNKPELAPPDKVEDAEKKSTQATEAPSGSELISVLPA